jgi:hypothetical protein
MTPSWGKFRILRILVQLLLLFTLVFRAFHFLGRLLFSWSARQGDL